VLQLAQLAQMVDAIGERLNVAIEHRAGSASAKLVPGAVNVEIFGGGFLAFGDGGAHVLAKNLGAAARKRIQTRGAQLDEGVLDGLAREPGEMQNFNRRKAFQLQAPSSAFKAR